jgi:hypothetical protein
MNECCFNSIESRSYAKIIVDDENTKILWRVICHTCAVIIYEHEVKE